MTMQRLCHLHAGTALIAAACLWSPTLAEAADAPTHDYPTHARVEYVQECIATHGGKLSNLYQCSCALDRIAQQLSYDDFVESSTFAKYSSLPGEGGALFRDSDRARELAKRFRDTEAQALRSCGLVN
ncbi:MAG TPA: hypothetical protein VNA21_15325 [Steroidobacteraceae bacterium]|nr:hypothetical protein [Steroidobacteraceae bacterium]